MYSIRKYQRIISMFFIAVFLNTIGTNVWANNGGPKQPETADVKPIGTTDMVDPFTGNFSYNIPLLEVGGYPINISYSSDPSMEQTASWVGFGWNLGVGNIDRQVRGLPDDFAGDPIHTVINQKVNETIGIDAGLGLEVFGFNIEGITGGLEVGLSVSPFYNNYTGYGGSIGFSGQLGVSASKSPHTINMGANLLAHSNDGVTITPSVGYQYNASVNSKRSAKGSIDVGRSYNTMTGWSAYTLQVSAGAEKYTHSASSVLSYARPTSFPTVSKPIYSLNLNLKTTVGGELFGTHVNGTLRAYYAAQGFKSDLFSEIPTLTTYPISGFRGMDIGTLHDVVSLENPLVKSSAELTTPAYGYLYAEKGKSSDKVIHDCNRENDGPFTNNTPHLSIPVYTHDVYQTSGHGVGGMFRPFRNDIGVIHDSYMENSSTNLNFPPLEVGAGNAVKFGVNASLASVNSRSGLWRDNNDFLSHIGFSDYTAASVLYQPTYFRQSGELSARFSSRIWDNLGGGDPVAFRLFNHSNGTIKNSLNRYRADGTTSEISVSGQLTNEHRQPRNQNIQFLNAAEAKTYGVEKDILVYGQGNFAMDPHGRYYPVDVLDRADVARGLMPHHVSQMVVTTPAGMRYVYGIPAYNTAHKEVSFAAECNAAERYLDGAESSGLVMYTPGQENSIHNTNGIDNHYEEKNIPPYANNFLLSTILSDDFVDQGNDGPSDDDIGTYTKFNYSYAGENKWRSPYQRETAHYFEGFYTNKTDGRGSYSYGTRQLWYMHSIETKTHVAQFILEDRDDAMGVIDENGGADPADRMKKLVRIDLFAKSDKLKEVRANGKYKAVPLKSVHFEYDYSLCRGTPDNTSGGGKLTLKKIYFTYQNSQRAALNPYEFDYNDDTNYVIKGHDRWGTYKAHQPGLNNTDFPYAIQDKTIADKNASSWNLRQITLPSGATIAVEYESDDYAYVQDKPAAQMFMIEGFGNDSNPDHIIDEGMDEVDNVVFFRLSEPVTAADDNEARQIVMRDYLKRIVTDNEYIYFKCRATIQGNETDYVTGYAKLDVAHPDAYGAVKRNSSDYNYGYIRLKNSYVGTEEERPEDDDNREFFINPIRKWGIGLVKKNMNWITMDKDQRMCGEDWKSNIGQLIKTVITANVDDAIKAFGATYSSLINNTDIARRADLSRSFIRLYNPTGNKLGGGSRVKRLTINDNWAAITGNSSNLTMWRGQEYRYTTVDGVGREISSGVAAWEPAAGGEENTFTQPIFISENRAGIPSEEYVLEAPLGQSFYPSPSVGYSKIVTRDVAGAQEQNETVNYQYNKTGHTQMDFYTARDFPTRARHTPVLSERTNPTLNVLMNLGQFYIKDYVAASQGYAIEVNDMHGKPKSVKVFQEAEEGAQPAMISSIEYFYKTDDKGNLDNEVLVMNRTAIADKNGFIEKRMVGVDIDFIADMNQHTTEAETVTIQGNLDTFIAGIFPIAIPIVIPSYSYELNQLRTAVTTKVITRHGLLDKVVVNDLGKHDVAKNEMYDAETGAVILSSALNQYGDPVYTFNYPAHFAYDQMGLSYKNADVMFQMEGLTALPGAQEILVPGDELEAINLDSVDTSGKPMQAWVKSVNGAAVEFIDEQGFPLIRNGGDGTYLMKVLRSGRRNLQSSTLGSVTTLQNPVVQQADGTYGFFLDKVLDAKAVEYDNRWRVFCNCDDQPALAPRPDQRVR